MGSPPAIDVRTHNKLNQITVFDAPSAPTPVLYDQGNNAGSPPQKGNGNIINDGTRVNAFDALNRLITVSTGSGTIVWKARELLAECVRFDAVVRSPGAVAAFA